jgi:hypothetical protein
MEEKVILKVEVQGEKANQGLKDVDNSLNNAKKGADNARGSIEGLDDALDNIPGAAGEAAQGVKGLLGQFKALVATPIGIAITAIAAAIGLLYKGLSALNPVVDAFEDIMGGLGSVINAVSFNIGNFVTGSKEASLSMQDAYKYGVQATQSMRDYEDSMKDLNLQNAIFDRQIDVLIRKAKNQALSEKERNALLQKAIDLQEKQILVNREVAKQEGEALAFRIKSQGGSFKQLMDIQKGASIAGMNIQSKALEDLLFQYQEYVAKRISLEGSYEIKRERINNAIESNNIKAEKVKTERVLSEAEKRADFDRKYLASKIKLDREQDEDEDKRQKDREQKQQEEIDAEKERENELVDIASKGAKARAEIAELEYQGRVNILNALSGALSGFAQLAGEQTKEGKALATASALINTYLAATQVLRDPLLPTVAKGFAVAGIIASGLANVKRIQAVNTNGSNSGGGGSPTIAAPIVRPSSSFTQLGNTEPIRTTNEGGKVKVFVTESDITSTQEKVGSIKAKATIQ